MRRAHVRGALMALAVATAGVLASAQSPVKPCDTSPTPAWCNAVVGDRAEGWLAQPRSEVMARNGIVATSQPLAAQAGLEILKRGGNAFDAAVATAAVLSVTEPMMVGPAGDMFAVLYVAKEHKLYAINASGKAPSGATVARMNGLGYAWNPANWGPGSGMPPGGILTVTVPGAVWGWDEVLHRFGTMTFKETLQPAIDYAEQGFPISERIASDWRLPKGLPPVPSSPSKCCTDLDPDAIATWYPGGRHPVEGQIFRNPGLARTYRILQAQGRDGFYKGEVAQAIVAKSSALGGTMTLDDLAVVHRRVDHAGDDGLSRVSDVDAAAAVADVGRRRDAQHPRGVRAAVGAGADAGDARAEKPEYWHFLVEAKKLAYADLYHLQRRPERVAGARRSAAVEGARAVAVRTRRSEARLRNRRRPSRRQRRHHRSVHGRSRRQHGRLGEQPLLGLRVGAHGAGLRHHAAQPRRAVHARSEEPQRDRAAQAAVQHALRRLRDEGRPAADDGHGHGRRRAGAGHRAGARRRAAISAPTCRRRATWRASVTRRWPTR